MVAKAEAAKVARDIAQVSQEAKKVGGPKVAQQALHAVHSAMTSAALHVSLPDLLSARIFLDSA